jgi:hypothetical protein
MKIEEIAIEKSEAKKRKMESLTLPYSLRQSGALMENYRQMKAGGIECAIVKVAGGYELWRAGIKSQLTGRAAERKSLRRIDEGR